MSVSCQLLVIGGGPAGHEAVLTAARLGLDAVIVEMAELGGTCLNRGCIPTKLFLGASSAIEELSAQQRLKIVTGQIHLDLPALQARKERLLAGSRKAVAESIKAAGARLLVGRAVLRGGGTAVVEGPAGQTLIAYEKCILATGSRPAVVPGLAADGDCVLDSDALLELREVPGSLMVIGSGAIGLEMAQFFTRLGARVTVIEAAEHLCPTEDPEIGQALAQVLKRKGMTVLTGLGAKSITTEDGQAKLILTNGEEFASDKALVAVGRQANSGGLGLETIGVTPGRGGFVATDSCLLAAPGVFAVGDLNGRCLLAHAAADQARYAARHAAGLEPGAYAPSPIPFCVYGAPELMRVGPTAGELTREGTAFTVSRASLAANPMAQAHGSAHGLVKVLWSGGRAVSVAAMGHGVSTLATQAALIVSAGWTKDAAEAFIFPHPSLDETLKDALVAPDAPA